MLEGIEILNKVEIMESPMWTDILIIIFSVLFVISIIIGLLDLITLFLYENDIEWIYESLFVVSYIGIFISLGLNDTILIEPTGKYEYQVTIDDNVSMNEFLEKYEIIEINGKIYTIRDKEIE